MEGLRMKLINNHGRIPMPPPYEGSMSNASMGEWGSHTTTFSTIHVDHEVFMPLHPTNARRRNANITYQIGSLHHWRNLEEDRHNHNTSKDTTRRTININHREIKEEGGRKENNNASNPV
jgi:hypothetical protein